MRLRIARDWASYFEGIDQFLALTLSVDGGRAALMQVRIPASHALSIAPELGQKETDHNPLTTPVMLMLLDRLSRIGADGLDPLVRNLAGRPVYVFEVEADEAALASRLAAEKSCKYQNLTNAERSCGVAVTMMSEVATETATTRYKCGICPVQDVRVACSNFSHARVLHRPGGTSIELRHAECELHRGEVDQDRAACRPGGHGCWERELDFEEPSVAARHELALHELFEFVDARWKAAFGGHLLSSRRGMAFGKLATPCSTSADLEAKLSALAHVMKGLEVADGMLKEEHRRSEEYGQGRSLKRLESALAKVLAGDPAAVEAVTRAITVLRDANALRNDAQHGGDAIARYARFGLPYPPPAARETWARIQSKVAEALHRLAEGIPDS